VVFKTVYFSLKKISSIFFLSLLVLFNYSKVLMFLHCQVDNFIATGTTDCDCEKQIEDSSDNGQANALKITTFREKPSENNFIFNNRSAGPCGSFIRNLLTQPSCESRLTTGFISTIFEPPKAIPFTA
jgi:hypothetical protein